MSLFRGSLVLPFLLSAVSTLADDRPAYTIYRAGKPITIDGRLDEPAWFVAPSVGPFRFAWWTSGKREQTLAKILWDDQNLYVAYVCQDANISAGYAKHDEAVCNDDCVELFTAPDPRRLNTYFNIEMNAKGTVYDDFHPQGVNSEYRPNWNAEGLRIATRIRGTLNNDSDRDESWTLEVAIPFKVYARVAVHTPPQPGDVWRLNLNRCGGKTNLQYSQWAPGTEKAPQFHAPNDFGFVTFSGKQMPF